jgi:hypothetical protein
VGRINDEFAGLETKTLLTRFFGAHSCPRDCIAHCAEGSAEHTGKRRRDDLSATAPSLRRPVARWRHMTIKPGHETFSVKTGPQQKDCRVRVCLDGVQADSVASRADCGSNLDYEDIVTTNFDQNQRLRQVCPRQGLTGENHGSRKKASTALHISENKGPDAGSGPNYR